MIKETSKDVENNLKLLQNGMVFDLILHLLLMKSKILYPRDFRLQGMSFEDIHQYLTLLETNMNFLIKKQKESKLFLLWFTWNQKLQNFQKMGKISQRSDPLAMTALRKICQNLKWNNRFNFLRKNRRQDLESFSRTQPMWETCWF